jgi:hypothetical protein
VGYASQVHPSTVTGAPPPLPRSSPDLIAAAYPCSTRSAVAQFTVPLATMIATGTFTPVRVRPHDVPVAPAGAADEHPPSTASPSAQAQASASGASRRPAVS